MALAEIGDVFIVGGLHLILNVSVQPEPLIYHRLQTVCVHVQYVCV